jgi:hypothetical protein
MGNLQATMVTSVTYSDFIDFSSKDLAASIFRVMIWSYRYSIKEESQS